MSEEEAELGALLAGAPNTRAIVEAVLAVWSDHARYLTGSFRPRSAAIMAATERAAGAAITLMDGAEATFAADYRWTCDRLRDEELFFHREERYRLSTFAEAYAEVYSDHDYMARYVNGLLLSQVLWYNHAATFEMFLGRVLGEAAAPFDYLEIGPGHGLMTYFAAGSPLARRLEAWDVSEVSLRETRAALDRLAAPKPVTFTRTDILGAEATDRRFDLIVISEVLEHLETPDRALAYLRAALAEGGRIFVNVPLNSPSPDHIYLLSDPDEARSLVEAAGFRITAMELFATQATRIERALRTKVSVSAGILAVGA